MNTYIAILICLSGISIIWWKNKRKFDRTNKFGEENFKSYFSKAKSKLFDHIIGAIGTGLLIGGGFSLTMKYAEGWFWAALLLLAAVGLETTYLKDRKRLGYTKHDR